MYIDYVYLVLLLIYYLSLHYIPMHYCTCHFVATLLQPSSPELRSSQHILPMLWSQIVLLMAMALIAEATLQGANALAQTASEDRKPGLLSICSQMTNTTCTDNQVALLKSLELAPP